MNSLVSLTGLAIFAVAALIPGSHPAANHSQPHRGPMLINTCLITTKVKAQRSGDPYAEFPTSVGVLAIFSADAQEKYIPGSAESASDRSVILEFKVDDVDQEYARLQPLVKIRAKRPTTPPWGIRSIYFRDPDGNLVDFYMPAPVR